MIELNDIRIVAALKISSICQKWASGLDTAGESQASAHFEDCENHIDNAIKAGDAEEIERAAVDALEWTKGYLYETDFEGFLRELYEAGAVTVDNIPPAPLPRVLPEPWKWNYPFGDAGEYTAVVTPIALTVRRAGDRWDFNARDFGGKYPSVRGTADSAATAALWCVRSVENWLTDLRRIEELRKLIPPGREAS